MSNITVCARFRPLSSKERRDDGDRVCIGSLDETFILTDDKEEDFTFSFDWVFYQGSDQVVYEFLALPIVRDAFNAINGTIVSYGQTGAGKTYSMEGPSIVECDKQKKGLIQRVVDGLYECSKSSEETTKCAIKLSMNGIANRAVGETQMNMASSRSHCIYMFTVRQELTMDNRVKTGKVVLVDLAGSEKVEKTGAEGRVIEEAKTINKSLSALGNVIKALTCSSPLGKVNHIPYRDSKLTRILQDALGENSPTALLCCCSQSPSNASEILSNVNPSLWSKLCEKLDIEDVKLLEELFILEGIFFDPESVEDLESAYEDVTLRTFFSLQQAVEELLITLTEIKREKKTLQAKLAAAERFHEKAGLSTSFVLKISGILSSFSTWLGHSLTSRF